jgi:hypothetical protein
MNSLLIQFPVKYNPYSIHSLIYGGLSITDIHSQLQSNLSPHFDFSQADRVNIVSTKQSLTKRDLLLAKKLHFIFISSLEQALLSYIHSHSLTASPQNLLQDLVLSLSSTSHIYCTFNLIQQLNTFLITNSKYELQSILIRSLQSDHSDLSPSNLLITYIQSKLK